MEKVIVKKCKICGDKKPNRIDIVEQICDQKLHELLENICNFKLKDAASIGEKFLFCQDCVLELIKTHGHLEKLRKAFKGQIESAAAVGRVKKRAASVNDKSKLQNGTSNDHSNDQSTMQKTTDGSKQKFSCDLCKFVCTTPKTFKAHLKAKHKIEDGLIFKCAQCGVAHTTNAALRWHVTKMHRESIRNACPECGKDFFHLKSLQTHISKQHAASTITESMAVEEETTLDGPNNGNEKPTIVEHGNDVSKAFAKYQDDEEPQEEEQIKPQNIVERHECALCDFDTRSQKKLKKHMRLVHGRDVAITELQSVVETQQETTEGSGKKSRKRSYSINAATDEHSQLAEEELFGCSAAKCAKSFTTKSALKAHKTKAHLTAAEKDNVCVVCGKRFTHHDDLRAHMDTSHMVAKLKKCPSCGAQFRSQQMYEEHIFNEKCRKSMLLCQSPQCDRRFPNVNQLQTHMAKTHGVPIASSDED